jgi:SAM-dependent methyltransferase
MTAAGNGSEMEKDGTVSTWHYGLVARYWAEIDNKANPQELAFFRSAIEEFGQPVLDLGCGAGRLLLEFRKEGLDVDGCDISPDMIEQCRELLSRSGLETGLRVQKMSELDLSKRYRTIYMCGAFGLGSTRAEDMATLDRCFRHLEPGGALVLDCYLPYGSVGLWMAWTPEKHKELPRRWPEEGERKAAANGDELEWLNRTLDVNPLEQRTTLQTRIRLWRGGEMVKEEEYTLTQNEYFRNEMLLLLGRAGFVDVAVTAGHSDAPARPEDTVLGLIARKPLS